MPHQMLNDNQPIVTGRLPKVAAFAIRVAHLIKSLHAQRIIEGITPLK